MHRRSYYAWLGLVAVLFGGSWAGAAPRSEARVVEHRKPPFRFAVPEGWRVTTQTGYPPLLLRLTRTGGGAAVSLALGTLDTPAELPAFVARNNAALRTIGLRVVSSARGQLIGFRGWIVAAEVAAAAVAIQQLYIPHARHVLIWTMTCPRAELAGAKLELERMLENLTLR